MITIKRTECFRIAPTLLIVNGSVFCNINGIWGPASARTKFGIREVLTIFDFLEEEKEYFQIYTESMWRDLLEGKISFAK